METDAFGVSGKEDAKAAQAGVLDLIQQIGRDLHLRFADGGVLEAGDFDPRVHLVNVKRKAGGNLQQAEGQHAFLADAGLLRIELGVAFAGGGLQAHSLLRHNQQGAALFAGFAHDHLGNFPAAGGLYSGAGESDGKILAAQRLASQMQRDDAPVIGFEFRPLAQGRAADGIHVESCRHDEAQVENARARDVRREAVGQGGVVFAQRQRVPGFDPHIRFHGRSLQGKGGGGVRVTEGAAQGQTGNLSPEGGGCIHREILQVDGGQRMGVDAVQLDFIAGGDAGFADDLARRVVHRDQTERLLEGQGTGGDLRADEQGKGPRQRRVQRHPQLARVGIKAPGGRSGRGVGRLRRINHIGDGGAGGHIESQLGKFALGGPDGNGVRAFHHSARWHEQLRHLRVKHRLFPFDVPAARPPTDRTAGRRQYQRGDGIGGGVVTGNRNGLRRKHVHVKINDGQGEPVDQPIRRGQGEARSGLVRCDANFVLFLDVERAVFLGNNLLREF